MTPLSTPALRAEIDGLSGFPSRGSDCLPSQPLTIGSQNVMDNALLHHVLRMKREAREDNGRIARCNARGSGGKTSANPKGCKAHGRHGRIGRQIPGSSTYAYEQHGEKEKSFLRVGRKLPPYPPYPPVEKNKGKETKGLQARLLGAGRFLSSRYPPVPPVNEDQNG